MNRQAPTFVKFSSKLHHFYIPNRTTTLILQVVCGRDINHGCTPLLRNHFSNPNSSHKILASPLVWPQLPKNCCWRNEPLRYGSLLELLILRLFTYLCRLYVEDGKFCFSLFQFMLLKTFYLSSPISLL